MAQPFLALRQKVKIFEQMSPEMKNQYLYRLTDEKERQALTELMQVGNSMEMQS